VKKPSLIFLALCIVFFAQVICAPPFQLLSKPGGYNDIEEQYYCARSYGFAQLREGKLPLWNKHVFCGYPYLAEIQTAIFYPPNMLFFVKDIARAINWSFILHVFLAGLGVLLFLRDLRLTPAARLCGGLSFAFSAPVICHITAGHLSNVNTIAWIGFIFWALYRLYTHKQTGYALLLGLFFACQITAGHIQYFFYTALAAGAFAAALFCHNWKTAGPRHASLFAVRLATAGILALGLSAVATAPAIEYARLSSRHALTYEFCGDFSFPPENILSLVMPEFFGNFFNTLYVGRFYFWEMCGYAGLIALILALVACSTRGGAGERKHIVFFALLGLSSIILALGAYTPVFRLLYDWVPGFNMFRGNSKFIFVTAFSVAVLAGIGADRILVRDTAFFRTRRTVLLAGMVIIASLTALFAVLRMDDFFYWKKIIVLMQPQTMYEPSFNPLDPALISRSYAQALAQGLRAGLLILCLCGTVILRNGTLRRTALLGILIFDLWSFGAKYLIMFDARVFELNPRLAAFLKSDPQPFRIVSPGLPSNSGMLSKIENTEGYGSSVIADYRDFINESQGASGIKNRFEHSAFRITLLNKFTDMLNAKYAVVPRHTSPADSAGVTTVYADTKIAVLRLNNALARFFFVTKVDVLPHNKVLERIGKSYFHPQETALIEEDPPFELTGGENTGARIAIRTYGPEHIALDVENSAGGLLVVSDTFYPGWQAFVNGRREKIYRTNYLTRGVFLRAGNNRVEFRYRPASVAYGAAVSLISLCIALAVAVRLLRKKKRP